MNVNFLELYDPGARSIAFPWTRSVDIVMLTIPTAVVLSMWIGVAGCGCPISCKMSWMICFCRDCGHKFENCAIDMDGAVKLNWQTMFWKSAKEEIATGSAPGFCGGDVECIRVDVEDHV